MSSVTSSFAQVARRVGYFITLSDISGFVVSETSTYNAWEVNTVITAANLSSVYGVTAGTTSQILEDMGEIAKVNGQIFRKVRKVTQVAAGGALPAFFIVLPGGEYPMAGVAGTGTLYATANVARLG